MIARTLTQEVGSIYLYSQGILTPTQKKRYKKSILISNTKQHQIKHVCTFPDDNYFDIGAI